jgi:pyruvate formate lyase activating enzyme
MNLRVGGLVPLSTTDYPDHLSAVVFCQGCPWRCTYCHNPHLLPRHGSAEIPWSDVLAFLERRRGLLDAVVFSGGEPTLQPALPDAMRAAKALGFEVALHTAGIHPPRLAQVLPLVDWVGMDIKTEFHRYAALTGAPGSGERARQSMELILASGVAHEFRTTVHPALLTVEALGRVVDRLAAQGVRHYVLQEFRGEGCNAGHLLEDPRPRYLDAGLHQALSSRLGGVSIRWS